MISAISGVTCHSRICLQATVCIMEQLEKERRNWRLLSSFPFPHLHLLNKDQGKMVNCIRPRLCLHKQKIKSFALQIINGQDVYNTNGSMCKKCRVIYWSIIVIIESGCISTNLTDGYYWSMVKNSLYITQMTFWSNDRQFTHLNYNIAIWWVINTIHWWFSTKLW